MSEGPGTTLPRPRTRRAAATATTTVVVAAVLLAVVGAYHYTLSTLVSGLTLDTPLAYLGLVPVVALALAAVVVRRPAPDHDIHDRQVDLLVGLPLVAGALVVLRVLPHRLGSDFWLWRLDVLSLPLFAAGLVVLVFGTRTAWRLRAALGFLALAWPVPWTALLQHADQPLLTTTTGAVRAATGVLPLARGYGAREDAAFEVATHGGSFVVTVASACAGASSTLGFLLLGGGVLLVARGRRRGKLLWLATGLVLAWVGNVVRILLLLAAGRWGGRGLALDVLHPVLGTVVFAVTAVVMVLLLPRYGVRLPPAAGPARPARPRSGAALSRPWSRALLAGALAAATLAAGAANGALAANEEIAGPYGEPRLDAFTGEPPAVQGWHVGDAGQYPEAARYFGSSATWHRLLYQSPQTLPGSQVPTLPVSVDVVTTPRRSALNAFSVAACYAFHRFEVSSHSRVDLGAGLRGELFTYYNRRDHRSWNALAWEWPVRDGAARRYERVVLLLVDVAGMPVPALDGVPVAGSQHQHEPARLAAERAFLRAFARELVAQALAASPGAGRSA